MASVDETGVQDVKVKIVEYQQCVWSVEKLYVHRATVVRQTSMV